MVVPAAGRHAGKVGLPASGRHYQNPLFEPHRRADVLPRSQETVRWRGKGLAGTVGAMDGAIE
ncbi:hypothetical protein, partial [Stenotrophomonas maltophilia]|uniref:hypothetical protein n=1 Tax=Stenotrophomonas maltophilia TaxID=40324 RepID=UPI0019534455